jgi:hypothetical protein
LAANHDYSHFNTGVSAFIYGSFYRLLVYAFIKGRLRVTLISGEPGIGKATLVAQAARTLQGTGASVLYGHSEEHLGVPYQPWSEALSQLIEYSDEAVLREFIDSSVTGAARSTD